MSASGHPLSGIRVVELGHFVAAPTAGRILADLGADVMKVEPPAGEILRGGRHPSSQFYSLNRNKSSIAIDLKQPAAKEVFLRLLDTTDVVVSNYLPKTLERLGLDYGVMSARNPRIIHCAIRGFLPGPHGDRPMMDEAAQMMSGLAYMTGPPGQPMRAGAPVVDSGAAVWAVMAIVSALLLRSSTGAGQEISVGLFETAVSWLGHNIAEASRTAENPPPMPARGMGQQMGVGLYRLFTTSDGKFVFIGVSSDQQWERFCSEFHLGDLWASIDLRGQTGRALRGKEIEARIERLSASLTAAELLERLERSRVVYAPVNTPLDILSDQHLQETGALLEVPLPEGEVQGMRMPAIPVLSSAYPRITAKSAPRLGQHSRLILQGIGLVEAEIAGLVSDGIVLSE